MLSSFTMNLDDADALKFENIYYTYRSMMFNLAKSIVKNQTDAEDILQNALMKVADNLFCIEEIHSKKAKSFLITVTKNTALDFLRRQNGNEVPLDSLQADRVSDGELEDLVSLISYKDLCKCIQNLPSPYNEVLYFRFVYDYSIKQTAKILDRKVSTVKMQLVRGKKILVLKMREVQYG